MDGRDTLRGYAGNCGDLLRDQIARIESGDETEEDFPLVYLDDVSYNLRGSDGTILLSIARDDGWLRQFGDFVLLNKFTMNEYGDSRIGPRTVYDLTGTLLLDHFYGIIDDVPGPGGGLFVYLDPGTCVLLFSDGSTVPVPNAPVVESITWG